MRNRHTCLLCAPQPDNRLNCARDIVWFAVVFRTGSRIGDIAKLLAFHSGPASAFQQKGWYTDLPTYPTTLQDGAAHASLLAPDTNRLEPYASVAMIPYTQAADACGGIIHGYRLPWNTSLGRSYL